MKKPYKWAYDAETEELQVWPVSGPESWATPQHADVLSSMKYATLYQGRIVLDKDTGQIVKFVSYANRPFLDGTLEKQKKAIASISAWAEGELKCRGIC
jgi:hypothetical protein